MNLINKKNYYYILLLFAPRCVSLNGCDIRRRGLRKCACDIRDPGANHQVSVTAHISEEKDPRGEEKIKGGLAGHTGCDIRVALAQEETDCVMDV